MTRMPQHSPAVEHTSATLSADALKQARTRALEKIAPLWPLDRFVAVNPYQGLAGQRFEEAADTLASVAGARTTLPCARYLEQLDRGALPEAALAAILERHPEAPTTDVKAFLEKVRALPEDEDAPPADIPTLTDVAARQTGIQWDRLKVERLSAWAGAYFDEGQALWRSVDSTQGLFAAWKAEATADRTPGIMGAKGFRKAAAALPDDPEAAAQQALRQLSAPASRLDAYLHRLLMQIGGWSAYAARMDWDAAREGQTSSYQQEWLAVLLCWEALLLETAPASGLEAAWQTAWEEQAESRALPASWRYALILHEAWENHRQAQLMAHFRETPEAMPANATPGVQAVFCIDVRSEVFRRHLESLAPEVETMGFAGFFGFPVSAQPLGRSETEAQCPVLLTPGQTIAESPARGEEYAEAAGRRRRAGHLKRAWYAFKMGAISCFSFVGPVGLAYLPKLFRDGFQMSRPVPHPDEAGLKPGQQGTLRPHLDAVSDGQHGQIAGMPLEDRIATAEGALQAMSLTGGFAPLVMLTGHGAETVNNPYDAGLACGACGGRSGAFNAQVAAAVLNDATVRRALRERGVDIPEATFFLAALHNTTTDAVRLLNREDAPDHHRERLAQLEAALRAAGQRTRAERAQRMALEEGQGIERTIAKRARDWAEVRPEWGLAGCALFVAAPRSRTRGRNLEGRSFLHRYHWQQDPDFKVLELIMTAPMVVASWISLQYFASTVDNETFGSGNKALHNVVGRMGILEGQGGDLRSGLPWQSVHDGEQYQHEPLRLNVVIEAPREAMNAVLERHASVRQLCDHGWLHLWALDEDGQLAHRYGGDLQWEAVEEAVAL